jgi:hypothetical protein
MHFRQLRDSILDMQLLETLFQYQTLALSADHLSIYPIQARFPMILLWIVLAGGVPVVEDRTNAFPNGDSRSFPHLNWDGGPPTERLSHPAFKSVSMAIGYPGLGLLKARWSLSILHMTRSFWDRLGKSEHLINVGVILILMHRCQPVPSSPIQSCLRPSYN